MDDPSHSPGQEKEGDQQASVLPHCPAIKETKAHLGTVPFQPVLEVLADLERDGHKFAVPAARLVGLYRRLWESRVSKHIDGEKLEQSNRSLKEDGTRLRNERHTAVESSRERLVSLFDDWNYPSRPKMVELPDVAREERETACSELP
ncbi:unnamed protein product [Penicillium camemberti]|uniref:Str. FM013 n=1 Tax=Penicillium camemberti (strain FM 013) TaxID=1429867 RepID=A0A0G4PGG6_PENC3|nr:unnamed protein product [Penicillium camemberti]